MGRGEGRASGGGWIGQEGTEYRLAPKGGTKYYSFPN